MIDLTTNYLGLTLKNPLIIGSSGLTNSITKIKEFEEKGAGAIVLKSLFEEQILFDADQIINYHESNNDYPEALDYIKNYTEQNSIETYINLIKDAKKEVNIPIIASINCISKGEWVKIAKHIEMAGADALEINIFALPSNANLSSEAYEQIYFDIISDIKKHTSIPVAVKIGYYFSGLVHMIQRLSWTGIQGLVLFNRFFMPDIDLKNLHIKPTSLYSHPDELYNTLRWIALLSDEIKCNISATTGIHDAEGVIKLLLAGATTTQICSTLYIHGTSKVNEIITGLTDWMQQNNYKTIDEFRGKLNVKRIENPAQYYRVQYMKYHAGIE